MGVDNDSAQTLDWDALEEQSDRHQQKIKDVITLEEATERLRKQALIIDPTIFDGQPVPERRWLVPHLIPRGSVTLLSGDGGVGKSLIAMQLMTAGAIDPREAGAKEKWLGVEVEPFASLGFFCEDDREELIRRQDAINAHYGCRFSELGRVRWMTRVGEDNVMLQYGWQENAPPIVRQPFHDLEEMVRAHKAELIVIDTVADVFGGNENARAEVRSFVGFIRKLAQINDGAVLLMSHPSVAGLNSGSGLSGSTAWNNSVRSRLYLTKPKAGEAEDEPDLRELRGMKSNYAASGAKLKLRWQAGVFVREVTEGYDKVTAIEQRNAAERFAKLVALAQAREIPLSPRPSSTYAPLMIKDMLPEAADMTKKALVKAMRDAIAFKLVSVGRVGRAGKRRWHIEPAAEFR